MWRTKPTNFRLGSQLHNQTKTMFETAQATGRRPYFHFDGAPEPDVLSKLSGYGDRYGVTPVIDTVPFG
jgi:hypothetical protein